MLAELMPREDVSLFNGRLALPLFNIRWSLDMRLVLVSLAGLANRNRSFGRKVSGFLSHKTYNAVTVGV